MTRKSHWSPSQRLGSRSPMIYTLIVALIVLVTLMVPFAASSEVCNESVTLKLKYHGANYGAYTYTTGSFAVEFSDPHTEMGFWPTLSADLMSESNTSSPLRTNIVMTRTPDNLYSFSIKGNGLLLNPSIGYYLKITRSFTTFGGEPCVTSHELPIGVGLLNECPVILVSQANIQALKADTQFVVHINLQPPSADILSILNYAKAANTVTMVNQINKAISPTFDFSNNKIIVETAGVNVPFDHVGEVTFTLNYPLCSLAIKVTFIGPVLPPPPDRIEPSLGSSISSSNQVELSWTLGPTRKQELTIQDPTQIFYKFTIHPFSTITDNDYRPVYSTSLGLLRGLVTFNNVFDSESSGTTVDNDGFANTIAFPETSKKVTLTLPSFPASFFATNGFMIMMSPVDAGDDAYATGQEKYHAIWSFTPTTTGFKYIDHCEGVSCQGNDQCNSYTGLCESSSASSPWSVSPLIYNNKCTLQERCPPHFDVNSQCTQCICTSEACKLYTSSVQVNIDVDLANLHQTHYSQKSHVVTEQYFRNYLQLALGGLSTLPHDAPEYVTNKNNVPFPILGVDREFNEPHPRVGHEQLTVTFLNPAITGQPLDFSNVLITISIKPFNNVFIQEMMIQRIGMLMDRLKTVISSQTVFLPHASNPYLPFAIRFLDHNPLIRYDMTSPLKIAPEVRCLNLRNGETYGSCPNPTTTLLSMSPYWSTCISNPDGVPTKSLSPHCTDFNGDVYYGATVPQWCSQGWSNYPSVTEIPCHDTKSAPSTIQWNSEQQLDLTSSPLAAGSHISLRWDWNRDLYSSSHTVDIFIKRGGSDYSVLLGTVMGMMQNARVQIPLWHDDAPTATITIRCTNVATSRTTTPIVISIAGTQLCAGRQCSAANGQQCNKMNGKCECMEGHYPDSQNPTTICRPQCYDKCSSNAYCSSTSPFTCGGHCPDGLGGDLCDVNTMCGNSIDDLNQQYCSSNGFLTWPALPPNQSKTCETGTCECVGAWKSTNCSQCHLTDAVDTTQRCFIAHSNYTATKLSSQKNCEKCHCLPGFYGEQCEQGTIRGTITFEKTSEASQAPFHVTNTNTDNNGLDLITDDCKEVLLTDIASSLGIEQRYINITSVSQTSLSPVMNINHNGFRTQSATTQTSVTYAITPSGSDSGNGLTSLDELAQMWNSITGNYNTLPIGVTEASGELGSTVAVGDAESPQIASCGEGQNCDCADEEKTINGGVCPYVEKESSSANVGVMVGIIVGVVVAVALLFIVTILLVRYAKKNEKWCFKTNKKQLPGSNKASGSGSNDHNVELTITNSTSTTQNSSNNNSNVTAVSGSKTAIDLVEITDHGENLPDGWSKQQHTVTGDQFYVFIKDGEMKSQKSSPISVGGDVEDNGW